ncbi:MULTISPECIES: ABC transporter permease [unclassified Rhizobium]|jgi:polar amino acid transport system permease protein|uniref:ABC transporter permease n=1 Tax=unclassified Rhizobium TaxID=2613769 RepID=UPI0006485FFB|nr:MULTISPECIES: ABC transporter permease [unclassified Rhizobium]OJY65573.1 MAG: ABC transporter permease [Rhizobium sp. 60-20]RKD35773.1 amino acid ABC transporter membrane protein 2 (PAAT family) [Rhizobium sp. WW_1]
MNWELFERFGPRLIDGLFVTIQLSVISVVLGLILAVPLAVVRARRGTLGSWSAFLFTYLFRGTPLLAQVFLVYYGSGQFRQTFENAGLWWLFRDPYWCVLATFTLNTSAYQAEILRGAIQAVPAGQIDAAKAGGMTPFQIFRRITIPQAARLALRPFGNEYVMMVKASAIASVVTVFDLMGVARLAFQRTFDFQAYIAAAVLYVLVVEIFRRCWVAMERNLNRYMPARH